jgi:hypothetical protein
MSVHRDVLSQHCQHLLQHRHSTARQDSVAFIAWWVERTRHFFITHNPALTRYRQSACSSASHSTRSDLGILTRAAIMQSTLGCGRLSGRSQASLCNCRLKARGLSALTAAPAVAAVTGLQQSRAQRWPSTRLRSIWDDSLTLSDLREKLDAAVAAEDYAEAARIRDSLQ